MSEEINILSVDYGMVADGSICKRCGFYFSKASGHPIVCNECSLETSFFVNKVDKAFEHLIKCLEDAQKKEREKDDLKSSLYIAIHKILKDD